MQQCAEVSECSVALRSHSHRAQQRARRRYEQHRTDARDPYTELLRQRYLDSLPAPNSPQAAAPGTTIALAHVSQQFLQEYRTFYQLHVKLRHMSRGRKEQLMRTRAMDGLPAAATFKWPPADWSCII